MNVPWLPSCMRPQADVHLVCSGESLYGVGYPLHEGTNFLSFRCGEIADMETVAKGLTSKSPLAKVRCSDRQPNAGWRRSYRQEAVRRPR